MATLIYPRGNATVTVADSEKIAVFSLDSVSIYKKVGYPQHPDSWDLLEKTTAGEQYVSSAFSGATDVRVEAGAADVFYQTGADPSVSEPQADITAADATFTVTGLGAAQGGYAKLVGGTSSTSGNAGGEAGLLGGQPGATGVGGAATVTGAAGGATSGKGGGATVTGGAGTAGNASGGSCLITPGAKHGSGLDGGVFNRGTFQFHKMAAPSVADDTASLTDAQMVAGVLVATPTAAAAYTVRTGTQLKAALPTDLAAGDAFDLTIINIGGAGDDITLTAATDITIVGDAVVRPSADSGTEQGGQGTFRFRFVTGTTFVAYRVS